MPQGVDDFTIILPEWYDMAACELRVYEGLDQLWQMVERYKMTAPVTIRVVDSQAKCVRAIRCTRHPTAGWQLEDETAVVGSPLVRTLDFPLTINSQDAKGNILKIRVRFGTPRHEAGSI
jgi:hypothetical protein